jgi:tetratricopeptide (TPR) repeat protein
VVDISAQQVNIGGDVVGRDKIVYEAPAPIATSLHQLSPPPRDFTGREAELADLMAKAEGDGVTISGLHGMGGIGKTAFALVLADRLKGRYPDAQFYLDLKGASQQPLSVSEALSHIVRAYHPTAKLPESEADLRGLYQSVLHGQRALLLMDNAADRWQVEPLLPPASCFLLVTSRQHFTLPGLHAKNLDTLPPGDARDLLLKIAPRIDGHAGALARMCGYLPLALRLAGSALVERPTLTPQDYLKRLAEAKARLALVDASLSLSFDLLGDDLQQAWCALSVFSGTFDLAAAAAVWEVEREQAQDRLDALVRHSLVEWDALPPPMPVEGRGGALPPLMSGEGWGGGRARLHDLARVFASAHLDAPAQDAAQQRHAVHYQTVARVADQLYQQGGAALMQGLRLFDLEWKNIEAGQVWAAKNADVHESALELCDDYPTWAYNILPLRQHPRDRIEWREIALVAAQRLNRKQAQGWHLGSLGLAYDSLGEYRRAIEYHEQALGIAREIGDRYIEANALMNIGNAHYSLGEARQVIEFHEQALSMFREIGDRLGEGQALGNLGSVYYRLKDYPRACEYYEQDRAIAQDIGDRFGEGSALWGMAICFEAGKDMPQAIAHAQAALEIFAAIESPSAQTMRDLLAKWRGQE